MDAEKLAIRWRKKPPTAPGYYWWKSPTDGEVMPVGVYRSQSTGVLWVQYLGTEMDDRLGGLGGEWCGPLPVPGPAPERFCGCGDELQAGETVCVNCRFAREGTV